MNPMGKNCPFLKKTESHKRIHKWETMWESTESVERNVDGLRQRDICIRLRDKSFHSWDPLWNNIISDGQQSTIGRIRLFD